MVSFLSLAIQCVGVVVTVFSVWLVIHQIQVSVRTSQFEAMKQVAQLIRGIDKNLYNIPSDIIYRSEEFPSNPPPRYESWLQTPGETEKLERAKNKRAYFFQENGGHEEFDKAAYDAINILNEVAEYIEDGYVSDVSVLGQYHFLIIRTIHQVEAFRTQRSGDYGHRLLRLRHKAILYHYMTPKHSDKDITLEITGSSDQDPLVLVPRLERNKNINKIRRNYRREFKKKIHSSRNY